MQRTYEPNDGFNTHYICVAYTLFPTTSYNYINFKLEKSIHKGLNLIFIYLYRVETKLNSPFFLIHRNHQIMIELARSFLTLFFQRK